MLYKNNLGKVRFIRGRIIVLKFEFKYEEIVQKIQDLLEQYEELYIYHYEFCDSSYYKYRMTSNHYIYTHFISLKRVMVNFKLLGNHRINKVQELESAEIINGLFEFLGDLKRFYRLLEYSIELSKPEVEISRIKERVESLAGIVQSLFDTDINIAF